VLKGVSLSARDGDVVAIIGGSGSGKSTLLRCINCLENPTSGIIRVNGEEIRLKADSHGHTDRPTAGRSSASVPRLGMVFQSFNLWSHMTLIDNVIEVPVHVLGVPRTEAVNAPKSCWPALGSPKSATSIQPSCPAASSSAAQLRGRWPSSRASCCSTSRLRRSTPNWSAKF
jgi:ABC-type histidine transport system ATPase subunit